MKATWISCHVVRFDDGTSWPRSGSCGTHEMDLGWRLRYQGEQSAHRSSDVLWAASVVDAYKYLVDAPQRRIIEVVMALRAVELDLARGVATCRQCGKSKLDSIA
jgi:hypothetical protein